MLCRVVVIIVCVCVSACGVVLLVCCGVCVCVCVVVCGLWFVVVVQMIERNGVSVQDRSYVQLIGWQNTWEQAPGVPATPSPP